MAASQYFLELELPAQRGRIVARDQSHLAINKKTYLLYAQPKEITSLSDFVREISDRLHREPEELYEALSAPGRVWLPIAHKVDQEVVGQLQALKLAGLGFEKEPKRYYPEASAAAHLLGFVGSDENGRDKGYFGLEGYYDRELRGKGGSLRIQKDARGAPMLIADVTRIEPEDGRTLVLWLDRAIQRMAERRLLEGIEKYGAKEGSVVIMDPKSGGILGMAAFPNYDPGSYSDFVKDFYRNPLVGDSYEPGSTFKTLVMAAGLNEGVIDGKTSFNETGPVQVGEYTIRTWDNQYHGQITMSQILEHSSNVGMVFVEDKLGKEKFLKYIRDFGFGQPTGVDLEDETSPPLRDNDEWREIDLATASFGQGVAVTPLQMVRAVAALANGGVLMEPRAVAQIIDSRGRKLDLRPKPVRRIISPETASLITEMMVSSVDNGEAKWAKPAGYRIAGKTGTAQIPVAGHYDDKKTIASFVGFAPADDPQFVMLVTLREPASSPWGSETAAPLFFAIARDIFAYKNILP